MRYVKVLNKLNNTKNGTKTLTKKKQHPKYYNYNLQCILVLNCQFFCYILYLNSRIYGCNIEK